MLEPCAPQVFRAGRYRGQRPAQGRRAKRRRSSRRWRWRRCGASTPCSRSSARSMASSAERRRPRARNRARRSSPISMPGCARSAPSSRATTMSPRPWTTCSSAGTSFTRFLDDGRICLTQQCRRAGVARNCPGQKVVAVRGLRSRRPARGGHVQPDRHGENERHRSAGLARRRARPHRRASRAKSSTSCCRGIGHRARQSKLRPLDPRYGVATDPRGSPDGYIDAMVTVRKSAFRNPAHIARANGTSK